MAGPLAQHEPWVGESVTLVAHTEDRPVWTSAKIVSLNPFSVEFSADKIPAFSGLPALLVIHDSGRKYSRSDAKIADLSSRGDLAWLTFRDFAWEPVDNRDNPRFDASIAVSLRAVNELKGAISSQDQVGVTSNLSLGGALVELIDPVEKGTLVEFRAVLDQVSVRAMAVVAHTDETRRKVGLSFLDYVGSARYTLHQFLSKLAA
jgi:hypothetical protein